MKYVIPRVTKAYLEQGTASEIVRQQLPLWVSDATGLGMAGALHVAVALVVSDDTVAVD